jgi:hypothetical protein
MREQLEKHSVVGAGFGLVARGQHETSRSNRAEDAYSEKQLRLQLGGSGIALVAVVERPVLAALIDRQKHHQQQRAGGVSKSGLCSRLVSELSTSAAFDR